MQEINMTNPALTAGNPNNPYSILTAIADAQKSHDPGNVIFFTDSIARVRKNERKLYRNRGTVVPFNRRLSILGTGYV
ncbi:MAG TPA: hypothetical protein VIF12_01115 [Micavibrio sp.]|jgi:hypothetical protein